MDELFSRYCGHCGRRLDVNAESCDGCGRAWRPSAFPVDRATTKALLEQLQEWRREGLLSAESYEILRQRAEARFNVVDDVPAAAAESEPAEPAVPVSPRVPAPPPGPSFGALIVERQADILLYLGAFLLGVAALIFVAYQEDAVSAAVRVPVLLGYTLAGIAGGIMVRRWERVREAGHVFLALGALLVPLNFVLIYADVLRDQDVPGDLVWLFASVFCAVFYGALSWRGFGSFYRVPAVLALLSGWTSLIAIFSIPGEWVGAWYMLLAALLAAVAAPRFPRIVVAAAVLATPALLWSYIAITGDHHWQLAATHLLATVGMAVAAFRLRLGPGIFGILLLASATVAAALWPLDAPPPVFAYPFLAGGAAALIFRRGLPGWPPYPETPAWWYAAAASLAPLVPLNPERHTGWSGVGFMGSAALLAFIAWRNTGHGLTAAGTSVDGQPRRTSWWERAAFAWAAVAFAIAGSALWQDAIGVTQPHTGWVFAGFATAPAIAVALLPRFRSDQALGMAIPISIVAALVSVPQEGHAIYGAIFLAIPALAWLAAAFLSARWTAAVVGVVLLASASLFVRAEYDFAYWILALAFAGVGLAAFLVLARWRIYPATSEAAVCALLLSWGLHAAALLIAVRRLLTFQSDRLETGRDLFALVVELAEYRVLIALVVMLAAMVAWEGLRLGAKVILLPASAIAMGALLLAIGLANPENVQYYTAPVGLYLLAVGLVLRRSPPFLPPHLQWHETALIVGAGFIALPQVEQSFEPGGAAWGLVLIGEGLVFLICGFVLNARWLVPIGTLVLSGVAIRWLLESGDTVPYWITLGALGMLLLAGGVFVMLQAEWWSRTRAKASRWWQEPVAGE